MDYLRSNKILFNFIKIYSNENSLNAYLNHFSFYFKITDQNNFLQIESESNRKDFYLIIERNYTNYKINLLTLGIIL